MAVPPWLWPCSSRPLTQVVAARMRQQRSGTPAGAGAVPAGAGKGAAMAGAEADSNRARPPTPMAVSRSAREPPRLQAGAASGRHSRTSAPPACLCRGCGLAWSRVNTAHKLAWPQAARRQVGSAEGCARGAVPRQRASTTPKVQSSLEFSLRAAVNERWQDGF